METQVHILCSHCEKVLVEIPKEKRNAEIVSDIKQEPVAIEPKSTEKDASLNFKSDSQEEEESSFCEIKIDYSKNENIPSSAKLGGEIFNKMELSEPGLSDSTKKKRNPTLDRFRRMAGCVCIRCH